MGDKGKIASRIFGRRLKIDDENDNHESDFSIFKEEENKDGKIELKIEDEEDQLIEEQQGSDDIAKIQSENINDENESSESLENEEDNESEKHTDNINLDNLFQSESEFIDTKSFDVVNDKEAIEEVGDINDVKKTDDVKIGGEQMGAENQKDEKNGVEKFEFDFDNEFEYNKNKDEISFDEFFKIDNKEETANETPKISEDAQKQQEPKKYNVSVNELNYEDEKNNFIDEPDHFNLFKNDQDENSENEELVLEPSKGSSDNNEDLLISFDDETQPKDEIVLPELLPSDDEDLSDSQDAETNNENKNTNAISNDEVDFLIDDKKEEQEETEVINASPANQEVEFSPEAQSELEEISLEDDDSDVQSNIELDQSQGNTKLDSKEDLEFEIGEDDEIIEIPESNASVIEPVKENKNLVIEDVDESEDYEEDADGSFESLYTSKRADIVNDFDEITPEKIIEFFEGKVNANAYNIIRRIEMQFLFEEFIEDLNILSFYRSRQTIDGKKIPNVVKFNIPPAVDVYQTIDTVSKKEISKGDCCFILNDGLEVDINKYLPDIRTAKLNCESVYLVVLNGAIVEQQDIDMANRFGIKIIRLEQHISIINKNLETIKNKLK